MLQPLKKEKTAPPEYGRATFNSYVGYTPQQWPVAHPVIYPTMYRNNHHQFVHHGLPPHYHHHHHHAYAMQVAMQQPSSHPNSSYYVAPSGAGQLHVEEKSSNDGNGDNEVGDFAVPLGARTDETSFDQESNVTAMAGNLEEMHFANAKTPSRGINQEQEIANAAVVSPEDSVIDDAQKKDDTTTIPDFGDTATSPSKYDDKGGEESARIPPSSIDIVPPPPRRASTLIPHLQTVSSSFVPSLQGTTQVQVLFQSPMSENLTKYSCKKKKARGNPGIEQSEKWLKRYNQLKRFYQEHGHTLVPYDYEADPKFGSWVKTQRYAYRVKKLTMTKTRIDMLNKINFDWERSGCGSRRLSSGSISNAKVKVQNDTSACTKEETKTARTSSQAAGNYLQWHRNLQELIRYKEKYGDCLVPQSYPRLGEWVHTQRKQYRLMMQGRPSRMTKERIALLGNAGFVWHVQRFRIPCKRADPTEEEVKRLNEVFGVKRGSSWGKKRNKDNKGGRTVMEGVNDKGSYNNECNLTRLPVTLSNKSSSSQSMTSTSSSSKTGESDAAVAMPRTMTNSTTPSATFNKAPKVLRASPTTVLPSSNSFEKRPMPINEVYAAGDDSVLENETMICEEKISQQQDIHESAVSLLLMATGRLK